MWLVLLNDFGFVLLGGWFDYVIVLIVLLVVVVIFYVGFCGAVFSFC